MNCADVVGAQACSAGKVCMEYIATSTDSGKSGSWVITKDHPAITDIKTGETGCCLGKCFNK